jgi:hypothetical protein
MSLTKQMRLLYSFLSMPFGRLRMYGSKVLNDQSVPSLPVSPGRAKPANSAHKMIKYHYERFARATTCNSWSAKRLRKLSGDDI